MCHIQELRTIGRHLNPVGYGPTVITGKLDINHQPEKLLFLFLPLKKNITKIPPSVEVSKLPSVLVAAWADASEKRGRLSRETSAMKFVSAGYDIVHSFPLHS